MRLTFIQRDADVLYRVVPVASGLVAVLLSVVPLNVPGLAMATPAFALMVVYHWTVYRPDLMSPGIVFITGVLLDLMEGTPYIGVSPLTFLIVRSLILLVRQRAANQSFAVVWTGFLVAAIVAIGLQWLAVSALSMTVLSVRPFAFQILVTVAAYPIADYLLAQAQRGLLRRA